MIEVFFLFFFFLFFLGWGWGWGVGGVNIMTQCYQYRNSDFKDKMVSPYYLYYRNPHKGTRIFERANHSIQSELDTSLQPFYIDKGPRYLTHPSGPNCVIDLFADALAPNGVRPSTKKILTTK